MDTPDTYDSIGFTLCSNFLNEILRKKQKDKLDKVYYEYNRKCKKLKLDKKEIKSIDFPHPMAVVEVIMDGSMEDLKQLLLRYEMDIERYFTN